MSGLQLRSVGLIVVLAIGGWLGLGPDLRHTAGVERWPTDDAVYAVKDWRVGPPTIENINRITYVTRAYERSDGSTAILTLVTSPEAKRIYSAGADVPFLGSGYQVEPAPNSLGSLQAGGGSQVVHRSGEAWLMQYAYGERRGLVGNGPLGWGYVALDAVLGQANDYFLARVLVPLRDDDWSGGSEVAQSLARQLLPRLTSWFAA